MAHKQVNPGLFQLVTPRRVSDSAAEQVQQLIIEGKLQPGVSLPSQRELMSLLGVSRASLREALRVLETKGLIQVTPGVGSFVSPLAAISATSWQWDSWMDEHPNEILLLLEVAEALDPQAAALAASRGTEDEIEAIMTSIQQMEEAIDVGDVDGVIAADVDFHDRVSRASHNKLLVQLNESLSITVEARRPALSVPQLARQSLATHRAVALAIQARDPIGARQAMLEHIKKSEATMLAVEYGTPSKER